MYVEVGMYNLEKKIRDTFRSLLELIFAAASLLIDTVRTFFSGRALHSGTGSVRLQRMGRFPVHARAVVHEVHIRLPLASGQRPVQHLLAKLQVLMLQNDILELQNNPDYSIDNSNSVYIIFMLIGIIGYFTVPTVAGWIVQAGGAGNFSRNLNRTAMKAAVLLPEWAVPYWETSEDG